LSAQACIAVGSYDKDSADTPTVPLAERWDGSSWSILETPSPTDVPGGTAVSYLNDVACTSSSACTAVGYYTTSGGTFGLIERWNGGDWSIQPNPGGVDNNQLHGVSCTGEQECLAVGSAGDSGDAFSERWDGSSWEALATPTSGSSGSTLMDVSCVTSSACTAVGESVGGNLVRSALAERWDGRAWAILETPDSLGRRLVGVSCPAVNTCTAVGESNPTEDPNRAPATLAERWNGSQWAVHPTPRPADYPFSLFTGVSCATPATCEAVGQATNLTSPGSAALAAGFSLSSRAGPLSRG
jgi:hypothetical protein